MSDVERIIERLDRIGDQIERIADVLGADEPRDWENHPGTPRILDAIKPITWQQDLEGVDKP